MLYIGSMKKTTFVALLLLSSQCLAENLNDSLQSIESEWASIYYIMPKQKRGPEYCRLLDKTITLSRQHPKNAEPIIWEAIVKATGDGIRLMNTTDVTPVISVSSNASLHRLTISEKPMNFFMYRFRPDAEHIGAVAVCLDREK